MYRIIIVLAVILGCWAQDVKLRVEVDNSKPRVGDTVVVRCRIENMVPGDFIYWMKRVPGSLKEHIMGTNNFINYPYSDERYKAGLSVIVEETVYDLTIDNFQIEDAGDIGCEVPERHVKRYHSIMVLADVTDLVLKVGETTNKDAAAIELDDKNPVDISCTATGSSPAPSLSIFLGSVDLTDKFTPEEQELVGRDNGGLINVTYSKTLTLAGWKATSQESGKVLRCIAKVADFPQQEAEFRLQMSYAPTLNCPPAAAYGLYRKDALLTCTAKASPKLTHITWAWGRLGKLENFTETVDCRAPVKSNGRYHCEINEDDGDDVTVHLRFERLHENHFRPYQLSIANNLGEASATVQLKRDKTAEVVGSTASAASCSILALLTATLYYLHL